MHRLDNTEKHRQALRLLAMGPQCPRVLGLRTAAKLVLAGVAKRSGRKIRLTQSGFGKVEGWQVKNHMKE